MQHHVNRHNIMSQTVHPPVTISNNFPHPAAVTHTEMRSPPQVAPLNFSRLGANIVGSTHLPTLSAQAPNRPLRQQKHFDNFLRKNQGNGGSPVTLETNRAIS